MNNIELLSSIYDNPALVYHHLHPDFVLHSPGNNLIAGTFCGPEGMQAHFSRMAELTAGTLEQVVIGSVLADEIWAMVPSRLTASRQSGKILDIYGFGVWRFKDGLIVDHWESVSDHQHWDEFWS